MLVFSLTSFGLAGGEALQGHSKVLAILHRGAKRAIHTRVNGHIVHGQSFTVEKKYLYRTYMSHFGKLPNFMRKKLTVAENITVVEMFFFAFFFFGQLLCFHGSGTDIKNTTA